MSTVELPSPVEAQVDAWIVNQIRPRGDRTKAQLSLALPKALAGESALKTIDAGLLRLRNAGTVRLANNRYSLAPGVR